MKDDVKLIKEDMLNLPPVPYMVHEEDIARFERTVKRVVIALIICIFAVVASNIAWLYVWNQYDYVADETVTVDGENGNANFVRNGGVITNGENSGKNEEAEDQEKS